MKLAVFDFDGTITSKDTFLEFIKFTKGKGQYALGMLLCSPVLIAFKLHLIPNWKAKQFVFSYFFKGVELDVFDKWGKEFACEIERFTRPLAFEGVRKHQNSGDNIVIVSASIENWIRPWADKMEISNLLATQLEVDSDNKLTGKFLTKNCFGKEKVNRILQTFPNRHEYFLEAYGDSRGDKEMIEFANVGWYRKFE
jgi:HAD superfamily hydrolase (TIGR01490 family)